MKGDVRAARFDFAWPVPPYERAFVIAPFVNVEPEVRLERMCTLKTVMSNSPAAL